MLKTWQLGSSYTVTSNSESPSRRQSKSSDLSRLSHLSFMFGSDMQHVFPGTPQVPSAQFLSFQTSLFQIPVP